jgi:hypothetical protein
VCHNLGRLKVGELSWWIVVLNLLGSVFFGISAIGAYMNPDTGEVTRLRQSTHQLRTHGPVRLSSATQRQLPAVGLGEAGQAVAIDPLGWHDHHLGPCPGGQGPGPAAAL